MDRKPDTAAGGLAAQDCPADPLIRGFEFGEKTTGQLGANSRAQVGHVLGHPVPGEHDLAPSIQDVLDGVEKLELGRGLALEELDILHDQ